MVSETKIKTGTGVIFTARDIDYLVLNLSESQLKRELHKAELEAHACVFWELPEAGYWLDYTEAVRMALEIIRDNKPRPAPVPGQIDIEAVKQTNDIVAVIERYTELRQSGQRFIGRCPLHQDRHPSLTVYPEQQSWHCFQCNAGGDIFDFIQAVERCDFKQAAAILSR